MTATELIAGVLRRLSLIAETEAPTDKQVVDHTETLNDLMAEWEADGIDVAWQYVDNPMNELAVPLWALGPIKAALAVRLCAEYGKPVPADVALAYDEGKRLVIKRSVRVPIVSLDKVLQAPESTRWWTDDE